VSISLAINLRLPDINARTSTPPRRIVNRDVRFWRVVEVVALPKVGETLALSTRSHVFSAKVMRVDWHDDKGCFVVACQLATRSMNPEEYDVLRGDPEWTLKPLLSGA
jgi:hypothetical protein